MTASTRIDPRKLPQFNKIEQNFIIYKGFTQGIAPMECQCHQISLDCGTSDCWNRVSQMECDKHCKVGADCANQRLQKKNYPELGASWTNEKGYGILSNEHIAKGRLVSEYVGEIISISEANRRSLQYRQSKKRHHYIMGIVKGAAIDATNKGNLSRFINHSCEPNCVVEKWTVNRETRAGIFAKRDISENEEVTIDYAFEGFGSFLQKCFCGSKNCKGFIGGLSRKRKSNGSAGQLVPSRILSLPKIPKKVAPSQPQKLEVAMLSLEPAALPAGDDSADEMFENSGFEQQATPEVTKEADRCSLLAPRVKEFLVSLPKLEDVLVPPPPPSQPQKVIIRLPFLQLEDVLIPPLPPRVKLEMALPVPISSIPLPE